MNVTGTRAEILEALGWTSWEYVIAAFHGIEKFMLEAFVNSLFHNYPRQKREEWLSLIRDEASSAKPPEMPRYKRIQGIREALSRFITSDNAYRDVNKEIQDQQKHWTEMPNRHSSIPEALDATEKHRQMNELLNDLSLRRDRALSRSNLHSRQMRYYLPYELWGHEIVEGNVAFTFDGSSGLKVRFLEEGEQM